MGMRIPWGFPWDLTRRDDNHGYNAGYNMVGALEHEWWFGIPTWKANNNSNVNNKDNNNNLVGGLEHEWIMTFHSVGNVIIPMNSIIFQRGGEKPPTRECPVCVFCE